MIPTTRARLLRARRAFVRNSVIAPDKGQRR